MSDESLFRIAVIGVGKISIGSHIPATLSSGLTKLVALVDPDVNRAKKTAEEFGLDVEVKASLKDLTSQIDGVIIAVPNHLHAAIAMEAMELGFHVLIEKPLASTVEDAKKILAVQEKTNKVVAVGYCTRFYPNYQLLKELINDNFFGKIDKFAYQAGSAGGWSTFSNYILDRENVGGGVLVVTGTHFIDRMINLFGFPDQIVYQDDSQGGPEANARLYLNFNRNDHEISGYIHFSKTTKLNSGLVIESEKGIVVLADNQDDLYYFERERPDIRISLTKNKPSNDSPFMLQLEDFVQSCMKKTQPMVSGKSALQSLLLINKAYSIRESFKEQWYPNTVENAQ